MKIAPSIIAACMATALSSGAWAEQHSASQSSSSQSSQATAAQSQAAQQNNPALSEAQAQEFFRASDLVGKNTQTSDGQKIGEIKDIVFNQKGQIFALVNVGSSRWAVVPWQLANISTAKGRDNLVLNTTAQQLKSAPAVTKNQWGALDNPSFAQGVYTYFHMPENMAVGGGGEQGATGMSQGQGTSTQPQDQSQQNQQAQPAQPAQPDQQAQPAQPAQPGQSAQPAQPDQQNQQSPK